MKDFKYLFLSKAMFDSNKSLFEKFQELYPDIQIVPTTDLYLMTRAGFTKEECAHRVLLTWKIPGDDEKESKPYELH